MARLRADLLRLGGDRSGMAAIEYGLIMATLVAAAAVSLPYLKDQLGAVANTTRNDYLEVGLPRMPDSMSALLGSNGGVASGGTTQQTYNASDDDLGSRRYYDSDEFTYGELADTGGGSPNDTDGDGIDDNIDTDDDNDGIDDVYDTDDDDDGIADVDEDELSGPATIAAEDFTTATNASNSDLISSSTFTFNPSADRARAAGGSDASIATRTVVVSGYADVTVDIDFAARYAWPGGDSFESTDSFTVSINVNGSGYITDTFIYNPLTGQFVGLYSGTVIDVTDDDEVDFTSLSYDIPDNANSVQVTITTNTSESRELFDIGAIAINGTPATYTTIASESFNGSGPASGLATVSSSSSWGLSGGTATSYNSTGYMIFSDIDVSTYTSITASLSVDVDNIDQFENSGTGEDYFEVYIVYDGGAEVLLDRFEVNDSHTAFVGSLTGQTFSNSAATITYVRDTTAYSSAHIVVRSRSTQNEEIYHVDNYTVIGTSVGT
ncbi:MAG: hypothetical protein H6843_14680 [Rhodospirillaceae bacterium]|nr:hypothetical protein [Rhodospirillaceae bacterium]